MSEKQEPNDGDDAAKNADGLALIAAKLSELGYVLADGADIGAVTCETLQSLADAGAQAEEQLATAKRQLTAWKGQATRARAEKAATAEQLAEALQRDPQAKARELPADRPVIARQDIPALLSAIDDADDVEVVAFLDDAEALDVAPLEVRGGAACFRQVGSGLCLAISKWNVVGPAQITGWALYLDGELIAWRTRDGTLAIGKGQTFNLAGDVLF